MTRVANDASQTLQIFNALADEAWHQLGRRPLAELDMADIAAHADVDVGLAVAVAGDPQQLILGKMTALDDQALLESFADIRDAGEVPIREKILEAILHRFEVYAPYRAQMQALKRASYTRPDLALALGLRLEAVIRRMLAMAGDHCDDWRGMCRIKGVVGVVMVTTRVWREDDTPDLAPTMKELDRRMQQAEEWAVSLRLFQQSRKRRGQMGANEDIKTGRYGVDYD